MQAPLPNPMDGDLLATRLTEAGVTFTSIWGIGDTLHVDGVPPAQEQACRDVIAAHPAEVTTLYQQQATAENNRTTLRDQATTALQANRDFLALSQPTNAQVLAQVKALTRQNNGIIRLVLNQLDGTE